MTRSDRFFLTVAALFTVSLLASDPAHPPGRRTAPDSRPAASSNPGAGADADSPSDIPARGWVQIGKRVAAQFNDHRLMTESAAITFYALLALFPALAALVSIYGLFADPNAINEQLKTLSGMVPGGGMQIISDQVHTLASNSNGALGFGAAIGLATSLWSANQATKAVFDALDIVYDQKETRSYIVRTLVTLAFTLGIIVFLVIALAAVVAVPVLLGTMGLGGMVQTLLNLGRWPLLLVGIALVLGFIYRYGPDRREARWRWVTWGSAFAAIVWVIGSLLFSWYVSNFGSYNKTYGSLGAVIGFMTWIWLSGIVVLVGGEINAEMEHQTARDTTTGAPKPMGARGATKADTVAAAA